MARMKVYEAEIDGLHDWVVAAPNQRAALDAFGVHQDLFAQGLAKVATDQMAVKAGEANPLVPLRRDKGSTAPFEPVDAGGSDAWRKAAAAAPTPAVRKRPPSRATLDKAEAALERFEEEAQADHGALDRARRELEARQAALDARLAKTREKLTGAIEKARRAYREAGGR